MASGQKNALALSALAVLFSRFWRGLSRVVDDVMSLVGNGVMGSMFSSESEAQLARYGLVHVVFNSFFNSLLILTRSFVRWGGRGQFGGRGAPVP